MVAVPVKTYTLLERPELESELDRLAEEGWPRFLRQKDELGLGAFWPSLFTTFAQFQLAVVDGLGPLVAMGHTVPLVWDGAAVTLPDNLAEILRRATDDQAAGRRPTALCALAV